MAVGARQIAGRFASATKGASRSAEFGGVRATDPEARDRFTPPACRRLGPTDQAAVKAGRSRGTEQTARQAAQVTGVLHHLDRAETPEATGPKTIESPPGRPGNRPSLSGPIPVIPALSALKAHEPDSILSWVLHESLWHLVLK